MKIDGSFYDKDYFENGIGSGKSWLINYHWMPRRTYREAFAFIDYLGLNEACRVLDFGCAKGFLVRALRELEIPSDGCDISEYALSFAPRGCWNCADPASWEHRRYTHVVSKDVFEHLQPEQLTEILNQIYKIAPIIMCVVPIGDNGVYRIREYDTDISHVIAENELWWTNKFLESNWKIWKSCPHVSGLKDNWAHRIDGNYVFALRRMNDSQ